MPDVKSQPSTSSEPIVADIKPNLLKKIDPTTTNESSPGLLKYSKTSIIGDICINVGIDKYVLDRAMLVSKSNYFEPMDLKTHDENGIAAMIAKVVENESTRFSDIVDLIYEKELKFVLNEDNFFKLFHDMNEMRMELDMEIFKQFIDENISQKAQLDCRMFELYAYTSISPKFSQEKLSDYLLSTISLYFSDRLAQIYEMKEFLSLPTKAFLLILFNKSQNLSERRLIARICGQWICYDFQTRVKELSNLVNATRYRYGVIPYCVREPEPLIESLRKNTLDTPEVQKIEKCFEQLVFYHSEVKFASTSDLKDELCKINSGPRLVNPIDQPTKWMSLLEKDTFCDVAINVQGTIFKLHRIKLASASGYFYDIFTNPTKPLVLDVEDNSTNLKSTMLHYSLDHIDPSTFQSIIRHIYKQEIRATPSSEMTTITEAFQFLKINNFYEKDNSTWMSDLDSDIFKKFEFVCKNDKSSERYDSLVEKIISLWPKLDQSPQFRDISLDVLKEILALPQLKIDDPDEILDLCSEWIFYDIENRYHCTIEVAQAINRNFIEDSEQFKLEIPPNSTDYSKQYVKEQLSKILSSTALVSLTSDCNQNMKRRPSFLFLNKDNFLSVLDVNFDEIIQIVHLGDTETVFDYAATMFDDKLFLLFNIGDQFYFQVYYPSSNRIVSLAVDERMHPNPYDLFNCNGEIYLWVDEDDEDDDDDNDAGDDDDDDDDDQHDNDDDAGDDDVDNENKNNDGEDYISKIIILKYCFKLNRWITFLHDSFKGFEPWYISDSKRLYRIHTDIFDKEINGWRNKVNVLDFQRKIWIPLPDIPIITQKDMSNPDSEIVKYKNDKSAMNILNRDLSISFGSKTFIFNWISRKWTEISNFRDNFVDFTGHEQNVIFISDEGEVHLYSPFQNKWTFERKLENFEAIYAIPGIDE